MNVLYTWSMRNNADATNVVILGESVMETPSDRYIVLDKANSNDSCEITITFTMAVNVSSIHWILGARICEVYLIEQGKTQPSYLATKRCVPTETTVNIDNISLQLFSGSCELDSSALIGGIKIRCLSIKEKIYTIVKSIEIVGKTTEIITTVLSVIYPQPELPDPINTTESLRNTLSTAFAQQLLFDGKMKSMEERLGLKMERLVSSLTESYKKQNEELKDKIAMMEDIVINLVDKVNALEEELMNKQSIA